MIYTFFIVFQISLEYFWMFCGIITVSFKLLFSLNSIFIFLYINSNQMFYFLHLREQATRLKHDVSATTCPHYPMQMKVYSYFEKGCRKKCARDNLDQKGNIGYYQYTVPDDCSCRI